MFTKMNLYCVVFVLALFSVCRSEKKDFSSPSKFRSGKVKQVWDKAIRMNLPQVELAELHSELQLHDEMLMERKRTRDRDDDGTKDAELTEKLLEIMGKYGLGGKKPVADELKRGQMNHRFLEDSKLDKLWQTAQKKGKFTKEELATLETEFHHHRRKVEELDILKSEISEIDDLHDNSVEKQLKQEEKREKKQKMAELYGEIQEGYERLSLKTKQSALSEKSVPFTEPRVAQLWQEAQEGDFSEQELRSLKEELRHFQTRIQKHMFFKDQLKNSMEKINYHGGEDKAPQQHVDTNNHLQQKVNDLASKVKKIHRELAKKLSSGADDRREL